MTKKEVENMLNKYLELNATYQKKLMEYYSYFVDPDDPSKPVNPQMAKEIEEMRKQVEAVCADWQKAEKDYLDSSK